MKGTYELNIVYPSNIKYRVFKNDILNVEMIVVVVFNPLNNIQRFPFIDSSILRHFLSTLPVIIVYLCMHP